MGKNNTQSLIYRCTHANGYVCMLCGVCACSLTTKFLQYQDFGTQIPPHPPMNKGRGWGYTHKDRNLPSMAAYELIFNIWSAIPTQRALPGAIFNFHCVNLSSQSGLLAPINIWWCTANGQLLHLPREQDSIQSPWINNDSPIMNNDSVSFD